jgi:hypothetical protein
LFYFLHEDGEGEDKMLKAGKIDLNICHLKFLTILHLTFGKPLSISVAFAFSSEN